ncbi:MAG: protein kinase [Pseudomonadota bacterium]|nr:protein kinase [Pseudomonadota bacterium]
MIASGEKSGSDETQIFRPDAARMAEHLEAQIAAHEAEHRASLEAARRSRESSAHDEGDTARPISSADAAQLVSQAAGAPPPLTPSAAAVDDDLTLIHSVRPLDPPEDPMAATQLLPRGPAAGAAVAASAGGPAEGPGAAAAGARPDDLPPANQNPSTLPHSTARAGSSAPDPQMRQVGRYLVKSRLGRGGMATVYRAHDPSIGRDVAIKFLHASLSEDDECRMRFLREARAAGGLSHPNIVVVHDVGEIERRPYMAMELIDGAPLSETLDKERTLPIRDVVVMGLQLARALEYAHARGVVHRDIKPGNIMLMGDQQTIKVADFGIAHMEEVAGEQRTMIGAVMGTPQYMSPEQTRGDKVDGRSDLFSVGIVLYQMLTGERPFKGESLVAVATKIANEEPPPLAGKRRDVPASLRRVVDRCLAKQPAQRFQSGKELAAALLKVLGEVDEAAREKEKQRILPLRVKWALMMSLIVAVVMGLTAAVITQRQYAAMMGQVTEYGAAMARFIAAQNAANVLGEDWDTVDVAVQEIMKTGNFERVSIMDAADTVRVSSVPALVGKPYRPEGAVPLGKAGLVTVTTRYVAQGEDVLGFEAPVLFQGKQVGHVALGVPEKPLIQVARLSISLMVVLAVVTVLAVAIAMYLVANWFAKPIRLVGESMAEIGKGRFDHRIQETRNDEFGMLFKAFDAMAQALQQRELERAVPAATAVTAGTALSPPALLSSVPSSSTPSQPAPPQTDATPPPVAPPPVSTLPGDR